MRPPVEDIKRHRHTQPPVDVAEVRKHMVEAHGWPANDLEPGRERREPCHWHLDDHIYAAWMFDVDGNVS